MTCESSVAEKCSKKCPDPLRTGADGRQIIAGPKPECSQEKHRSNVVDSHGAMLTSGSESLVRGNGPCAKFFGQGCTFTNWSRQRVPGTQEPFFTSILTQR